MTALCLALVALAIAQITAFITQRKRIMDLKDSLQSAVAFYKESSDLLVAAVDQMPEKITAVVQKGIADYLAANPDASVGSVPDDVILTAIQDLNFQSKIVRTNAAAIPTFFEAQLATGSPVPPPLAG